MSKKDFTLADAERMLANLDGYRVEPVYDVWRALREFVGEQKRVERVANALRIYLVLANPESVSSPEAALAHFKDFFESLSYAVSGRNDAFGAVYEEFAAKHAAADGVVARAGALTPEEIAAAMADGDGTPPR